MSIVEKLELRQKIVGTANTNYSAFKGFEVDAAGVYRVIQIANKKPYVAISGHRHENTPEQNKKQNENLLAEIKAFGLYAYEMIGGFEEEYEKDGEKRYKDVTENSFFVPYDERGGLTNFIEFFVARMKEFKQNSILFGLPKEYDYKDWTPQSAGFKTPILEKLEIGFHFFVNKTDSIDKLGTQADIKTFDKYGSIALDPKKNRIIDWVIAGVTLPNSPSDCFQMNRNGLKWFWDSFPEVKASDYEGETKQRAVQKIKDHYRKVGEKI